MSCVQDEQERSADKEYKDRRKHEEKRQVAIAATCIGVKFTSVIVVSTSLKRPL